MFDVMGIEHDEGNGSDYGSTQAYNAVAESYYSAEADAENNGNQEQRRADEKKKKLTLYDRLDGQWLVLAEIGFTISSILGSCSAVCLMRVFGAGAMSVALAVIAAISAGILLMFFWGEIKGSVYKLRIFLILLSLSAGFAISMSDMVVDFTRHYWAAIVGATIATAGSSVVILALIIASRMSANTANNQD